MVTINVTQIYVFSKNDDKNDNQDHSRSNDILYNETMSDCFLTLTQLPNPTLSTNYDWFLKECARFHMSAIADFKFLVAIHHATCNPLDDEVFGGNHMSIITDVQGAIQGLMHLNPRHIEIVGHNAIGPTCHIQKIEKWTTGPMHKWHEHWMQYMKKKLESKQGLHDA